MNEFRIYDNAKKEYLYDHTAELRGGGFFVLNKLGVIVSRAGLKIIEKNTGFKDKRGREIYENDRVVVASDFVAHVGFCEGITFLYHAIYDLEWDFEDYKDTLFVVDIEDRPVFDQERQNKNGE